MNLLLPGIRFFLSFPSEISFGKGAISVLRNAGYFLGGRGLNSIIRFGYVVLLTRFLGPDLYGQLAYGISWYLAYLPLTALGLEVIMSHRIGKGSEDAGGTVSRAFTLKIGVSIIVAITCGITGWFLEVHPEMKRVLLVFSFALFGRAIASWVDSVLTAHESMKHTFHLSAVFRPLEVAAGVVILFCRGGIFSLAVAQALSWWAQAAGGLLLITRMTNGIRISREIGALGNMLFQSLPIMAAGAILNWMLQGPLILYRGVSNDPDGIGQLALAMQILMVLSQIPLALNAAALPVLSRSAVRKDDQDVQYLRVMIRAIIIGGTGLGIFGMGLGPWLVEHIFGSRFVAGASSPMLSIWLLIPWSLGTSASRVFFARGNYYVQVLCAGAGAALMMISMPYFASRYGFPGALAAAGTGMLLWSMSLLEWMARKNAPDLFRIAVKPLVAASATVVVFLFLMKRFPMTALPAGLLVLVSLTLLLRIVGRGECSFLLDAMPLKKNLRHCK